MASAKHLLWLKAGVKFWNSKREEEHFVPNLRGARLNDVDLTEANLRNAVLIDARLRNANLYKANLIAADLTNADLSGANLERVGAQSATFKSAKLFRANLRDAFLNEADFRDANLIGADLSHSIFHALNLKNAKLSGAIILSNAGKFPKHSNFSGTTGLTQEQIQNMVGDTGVLLPSKIIHPSSWPRWVDPTPKNKSDDKISAAPSTQRFVFISYSNADRETVSKLASLLQIENISIWWDQNINPGDDWRASIQSRLAEASVVLTVWTKNSVVSKAVIEEASKAQIIKKLVHIRLDRAALPYGFSETQYADFQSWDGTHNHPEAKKLIQLLRDKLYPPTVDELIARITSAAPIAAVLEDGLLTAKDSPPDAKPPINDPVDLEARLAAQRVLVTKAHTALQTLDNNLGEAIRFDMAHLRDQLEIRPASWYILSDGVADLGSYLVDEDISWPGATRSTIERICKNHELLRPLLQPTQSNHDTTAIPPEPSLDSLTDKALREVAQTASEAFGSGEASHVLSDPAKRTGQYLAAELSRGDTSGLTSEGSIRSRRKKIRNALLALAGFVGTSILQIGYGVSGNLLTSPGAAIAFVETLKSLLQNILSFF